jgi:hypothetical protein
MALIEYVGAKPSKPDNVAGTGIVWHGPGDVQEVPDPAACALLLRHREVWREQATAELVVDGITKTVAQSDLTTAGETKPPVQDGPKFVLVETATDGSENRLVLDDMDLPALTRLAEEAGHPLDGRIKSADKARETLFKALSGKE